MNYIPMIINYQRVPQAYRHIQKGKCGGPASTHQLPTTKNSAYQEKRSLRAIRLYKRHTSVEVPRPQSVRVIALCNLRTDLLQQA